MLIYNVTTKHLYATRNYQVLAGAIENNGWQTGEFAGYRQWLAAGRAVKRGEKGTPIAMVVDKNVAKEGETEKVKVVKKKHVFNIAQTEPLPATEY